MSTKSIIENVALNRKSARLFVKLLKSYGAKFNFKNIKSTEVTGESVKDFFRTYNVRVSKM